MVPLPGNSPFFWHFDLIFLFYIFNTIILKYSMRGARLLSLWPKKHIQQNFIDNLLCATVVYAYVYVPTILSTEEMDGPSTKETLHLGPQISQMIQRQTWQLINRFLSNTGELRKFLSTNSCRDSGRDWHKRWHFSWAVGGWREVCQMDEARTPSRVEEEHVPKRDSGKWAACRVNAKPSQMIGMEFST